MTARPESLDFVESEAPPTRKFLVRKAFLDSLPVCFGYLPMGIAYGIFFVQSGLPWIYAVLSAVLMFAGSAQYLSVELFAAHSTFVQTTLAIFFLNIRHIFYGLSLINRFRGFRGWRRFYSIFALTDESYSLVTSHKLNQAAADRSYMLWVEFLNHCYWITGCTLGALAGNALSIKLKGLDFVLTAVFVVLLVEQVKKSVEKKQAWISIALGAVAACAGLLINPKQMLLISLSVTAFVLLLMARRQRVGSAVRSVVEEREPIGP